MNLPVFLPIEEASRKYNIPPETLTLLVQDGKIPAIQLDGRVAVSEQDLAGCKTKEQIIAEKYAHLVGQAITISEAVKRYGMPRTTLLGWIEHHYVRVISSGYRAQLDEADVAYCADAYAIRQKAGGISGVPLLDECGRPYELKHLKLHEYRRRKRKAA